MIDPEVKRQLDAMRDVIRRQQEAIHTLEGQVGTLQREVSKSRDPLREVFVAKMTSATAWTERTSADGSAMNDFTSGRSGTAAPATMDDGQAVLMEVPGASAYGYLRIAGGTTASPTTIGNSTGGAATADTATWARSGTAGGTPLDIWVTGRVIWDSSGDVLYAEQRKLSFDSGGNLFKVSGETRYTVDTPTSCT